MKQVDDILEEIQKRGYRKSRSREAVLRELIQIKKPVSVQGLMLLFKERNISFNKTTLYREIETLRKLGYIRGILLRNDTALYEINESHHHHLMCTQCGDVRHIVFKEGLHEAEKKIAKKERFIIQEHSLEFFGLCQRCS